MRECSNTAGTTDTPCEMAEGAALAERDLWERRDRARDIDITLSALTLGTVGLPSDLDQRGLSRAAAGPGEPALLPPSGSGTEMGATLTWATPCCGVMPIFAAVDGDRSTIRPLA